MPQKKTLNEFLVDLKAKNPDVQYVDGFTAMKGTATFRCSACGYEWQSRPSNVVSGHGCPKCARQRTEQGRRLTAETFDARIAELYSGYTRVSEYNGLSEPVSLKCPEGHIHTLKASTFLQKHNLGLCPECRKTEARDIIDEETFRREYYDEGLTLRQIAERHHRSQMYVDSCRAKYDIQTRSGRKKACNIDEATLRTLYCEEQRSCREIAEHFGCTERTVYRYLHQYGISSRHSHP